ncbi:MAG: hypothetical protein CM15mV5_2380 [uncultured marine virus]|nr:MAG: hypothetical protein CM15mV5_2380 [uncultured marine virus]
MRDHDQLRRLKEAKEYCASIGKPVMFSMLTNEGCWGGCPIMPEHYHYNASRTPDNPQYFNDSIVEFLVLLGMKRSCSIFKGSKLTSMEKDWEEMEELGIDVFKMHGRENTMRLMESMDIIKRWDNNEEMLFPEFTEYIEDISLKRNLLMYGERK